MISPLDRFSYLARQGARVAWYMGHYFATQDFRRPGNRDPEPAPASRRPRRSFSGGSLLAELATLFRVELANVAAGHYPLPRDHDGSLGEILQLSREFFSDVPGVAERKSAGAGKEVYDPDLAASFPEYFLQNFHYQTGGYLTEESARLYDTQVEILFSGSANAMRRQCIVPVSDYMRGRDQRRLRLLDVACGTGRLIRFLKQAFPRLSVTGLDLSPAYVAEARRHVVPYDASFEIGNAEALPFDDESFDLITSVYLFHEVPENVRRNIAGEFARVLKPGGRLIFMDSLQLGDRQEFDGLLNSFPRNFHEPYFASYLAEDLKSLFESSGFRVIGNEAFFLSKRIVCDLFPPLEKERGRVGIDAP
jgi:ubiquinone/menaquinone biosynthesis C-methylase UbiE